MSLAESTVTGASIVIRWVLATAAGYGAGLLAGWGVTRVAELAGVNPDRFLFVAGMICLGVTVGVAQSWVMLPYLRKGRKWIVATFAGHLFALVLSTLLGLPIFAAVVRVNDASLFILIGAAIGFAQWWVLRRHFHGAALWVAASAIGFTSFFWLVAHPASSMLELVFASVGLSCVGAVATGAALVWLTRQQFGTAS